MGGLIDFDEIFIWKEYLFGVEISNIFEKTELPRTGRYESDSESDNDTIVDSDEAK